jgi:Na+/proline symporter
MWTLFVVLAYGLVVIGISYAMRHHRSPDDYLMGSRQASAPYVGAALFTLVGGGELIALTALAFVYGWGGLALFIGYALAFLFLAMLAPRIRKRSDVATFLSLPDYVHATFGKTAGHLVFAVSFCAFMALLLIQFTAGGQILRPLLGFDYATCVFITGGIAATYLVIGGFRTVLATDMIQGASRLILMPLILWTVAVGAHSNPHSFSVQALPPILWISLSVTGFFTAASSADVWQRIYAARSEVAAAAGLVVGAAAIMTFGALLVGLGILAQGTGLTKVADDAFVAAMASGLPTWATYLAIVLVLSTIMGTADTEIFLLAGMLGRERVRIQGITDAGEVLRRQSIRVSRMLVLAIVTVAASLSLVFREVITIYIWLLSAILVISPIIVGSLFGRIQQNFGVASIVVNGILFIVLAFTGILTPENAYMIVVPGAVLYLFSIWRTKATQ